MIGPGDLDRHRPRRGHRRPLPLAADVARGLPPRPLPRRARGMVLAIAILLGTGLIVGWRIAHRRRPTRSPARPAALLFALAMIWLGHAVSALIGALARRGRWASRSSSFPADVPVQRVRPGRRRCPTGCAGRRVEPVSAWSRRSARCSATRPHRCRRGLAARAPGSGRVVDRADPGAVGAAHHPRLPLANRRVADGAQPTPSKRSACTESRVGLCPHAQTRRPPLPAHSP